MDDSLQDGGEFGEEIRVEIAQEEENLKKEEGGDPNKGTTAKEREEVFANYGFYLEDEVGT